MMPNGFEIVRLCSVCSLCVNEMNVNEICDHVKRITLICVHSICMCHSVLYVHY